MANKRLNQLDATATNVNASDFIHISQGGIDKKIPAEKFLEQVSGGNPFNFTVIEESSTSRTLTLHDVRGYIRCLSDSNTEITVLPEYLIPWKIGHNIIIRKEGEGNVTVFPAPGVDLGESAYGYTLTEPGQIGQLIYVGPDRWDFITGIDTGGGGSPVNQSDLDAVIDAYTAADQNLQDQLTGTTPLEASAFSEISWHGKVIQNSVAIPDNVNAWSFGPTMEIAAGQTVTIGTGSTWTIAAGGTEE